MSEPTRPPLNHRLTASDQGRRADKVVKTLVGTAPWSFVRKLFRTGCVTLEGRTLGASDRLEGLGELRIDTASLAERPGTILPNRKIPLTVVHRDEHVLVVNKPAGFVMTPGPGHGSDTILHALVAADPVFAELGPELGHGLVQRLDRDTSGLLIAARGPDARAAFIALFKERAVAKRYLALVDGSPADEEGEIRAPLIPGGGSKRTEVLTSPWLEASAGPAKLPAAAKSAQTRWRVLERLGPVTLVECRPETGRTHQVRAHLASIGLPVRADALYGTAGPPGTRHLLHAAGLAFRHPLTGVELELEAPLPPDFRKALKGLRRRRDRASG